MVEVFTSDNGFFLGEHGLYDKRLMYEPSIRVPLLVRYPAQIAPRVDAEHMVLNIDMAPTLLELAGIPAPAQMQGRSFVPLLERRDVPWRDDFVYEFFEYPDADHCVMRHRGIRTKRWKLIHFYEEPQRWELYDLEADPDEITNSRVSGRSARSSGSCASASRRSARSSATSILPHRRRSRFPAPGAVSAGDYLAQPGRQARRRFSAYARDRSIARGFSFPPLVRD